MECRHVIAMGRTTVPVQQKHKGHHAENVAANWLYEQGYTEVLRNLCQFGLVDMAGIKG
jgi:hypothetical protein